MIRHDRLLLAAAQKEKLPFTTMEGTRFTDLMDLNDNNFILLPPNYTVRRLSDCAFGEAGFHPQKTQITARLESSINLAAMGYGVAFTLDSYIPLIQPLKPLKYYRLLQSPKDTDFIVVFRPHRFSAKETAKIVSLLRKTCG